MPSIRDENTVNAIARAYIKLDRNKAAALQDVGYSHSFSYSGKGTKLYENSRLKAAIAVLETEIVRVQEVDARFLTEKLLYMAEHGKDTDKARAMDMLAKHIDYYNADNLSKTPQTGSSSQDELGLVRSRLARLQAMEGVEDAISRN